MEGSSVPAPEERRATRRGRSIVGPALLIALGALLLAQNLGLVEGEVWRTIWRLWPVLLIIWGLELVLGRGSWLGTVTVLALIGLAVVVSGFLAVFGSGFPWSAAGDGWRTGFATAGVERVAEELGDTRQAVVELNHGAGRLELSALPGDSSQLVQGNLEYARGVTIDRRVERAGDQTRVRLGSVVSGPVVGLEAGYRGDWQVQLSPQVPVDLRVQTGASALELDLTELVVTRLNVQTGASGAKIALPRSAGRSSAQIRAGVSGLEVVVPEGVAARIQVRRGLGGVDIDRDRFPEVGEDVYQSPDYDSAPNRVDLWLECGVGALEVR